MEVTKQTKFSQQEPQAQTTKYYSEEELNYCLQRGSISVNAVLSLIESNFKKDREIASLVQTVANLNKRLAFLEEKTLKNPGRKRQTFYLNGHELTDEELTYQIDSEYFTIRKLEKEVGAGKNQLRNRYMKAKKKQKLEKELKKNGNY